MANTVSLQTLHDGQRNLIVQVDIIGDGSGEQSASTLIDVSTYASLLGGGDCSGVTIEKVKSTLEGFTAKLLWDATTDVEALLLGQGPCSFDYTEFGGLVNNAGTGKTGDINLTTNGLGSADQGTLILEMRKLYG